LPDTLPHPLATASGAISRNEKLFPDSLSGLAGLSGIAGPARSKFGKLTETRAREAAKRGAKAGARKRRGARAHAEGKPAWPELQLRQQMKIDALLAYTNYMVILEGKIFEGGTLTEVDPSAVGVVQAKLYEGFTRDAVNSITISSNRAEIGKPDPLVDDHPIAFDQATATLRNARTVEEHDWPEGSGPFGF
jgi:hypothetical protein